MIKNVEGMIPPIITPLKEDESIDDEGFRIVMDFLIKKGVFGIFILGTAGEYAYFDLKERMQIAKIARDHLKSEAPLLMGISDISLSNSIKLLKYGLDIGVDGFVANIPQYFPLDNKQIGDYFTELNKYRKDKPLFAYDVSEMVQTTATIAPKVILELANEQIINGIKYSGVIWENYAQQVIEGTKHLQNFRFFAGSELITRKILEAGLKFDGGIYSSLNIFPRIYVDFFKAIRNKEERKIIKCFPLLFSIGGIFGTMGSAGGPTIAKEILKALGFPIMTKVRSPLPSLKKIVLKKIDNLFENVSKEGYLDKYE
jgi:dihydrodipicolinate synthase/N-acetylneuraminate lyase